MEWKSVQEIRKIFEFTSFTQAWEFVTSIATIIVGLEDHFNLEIYFPGKITPVRVSLGYRGNVTPADVTLAEQIEETYHKANIA